jgi:galactose mutarotase-like enzyme
MDNINSGIVKVTDSMGDKFEINPQGATLKLWLNHIPILIPVTRGDGKLKCTHTCTPIFGKDTKNLYGLAQHGEMREHMSEAGKIKTDQAIVSYGIQDAPGRYPSGIKVYLDLRLSDNGFVFSMTHTNHGVLNSPVNAGEHCYFSAPKSYKGTKINGTDVTRLIEDNLTLETAPENTIEIPGMPKIRLTQEGFNYVVLWVYKNPTGNYDQNYVCIEPMENALPDFGSLISIISPGKSRTAKFSLSL